MNAPAQPQFSLQEYIAWEAQPAERHEFYRGEVFAMVGAHAAGGQLGAQCANG